MSYYDYQPPNKFGYKDTLPEGDAEKIIKGSEFDDEFNKISAESQAIDQIVQENDGRLDEEIQNRVEGDQNLQNQIDSLIDGSINIGPDQVEGLPEYLDENYVSKATEEDQQIISKFTFSSTPEDGGILGERIPSTFVVDSSGSEASFISGSSAIIGDDFSPWDVEIQGSLQLSSMGFPPSYMTYTGYGVMVGESGNAHSSESYIRYIGASDPDPAKWIVKPNLDVEGDLSVGGSTEITGDITLNGGNIIIDGGEIVDPNGNPQSGLWTLEDDGSISRDSEVYVTSGDPMGASTQFKGGQGIEQQSVGGTENDFAYRVFIDGVPKFGITNSGNVSAEGNVSTGFDKALQSLTWAGQGPVDNGLKLGNNSVVPVDQSGTPKPDVMDLGANPVKFKDGYFSGTVKTGSIDASEDSVFGGTVTANAIKKSGGTSSQLLCADGSVVDKSSVGGSTDLSAYYNKTESDAKFQPKGNYLTSFTESDPTVPSHVKGITQTNINNWNTAHSWGDHSTAGYSKFSGSYNDLTNKPPPSPSPWTTETYGIKAEQSVAYIKGTDNAHGNHGLAHLTVEAFDHFMNTNAPNILAKSTDPPKIGWLQDVQDAEALYMGCTSTTDAGGRFNAIQFSAGRAAKSQNLDIGGSWQYSNAGWARNMRITGTYSGVNVTFRDSAGVTARDLIDVFVALKNAVSSVNESDPIAAMSSMRSAITTTSDSLIQKFEAIHEAVADELEARRLAMMEPPEGVDGTEPPQ